MEVFDVAERLQNPPPPVPCWIEPFILPKGSIMLFGGPSKAGKSFVALEFARALVTGDNPMYYQKFAVPEKARVLIWEQELGESTFFKRCGDTLQNHRISEYGDRFKALCKAPELSLSEKGGAQKLNDLLEEHQTNVLIIDPIGKAQTYDENDAGKIGELFNKLQLLTKAGATRGLSIILTHHFKKLPSGQFARDYDLSSPDNFRGSSRFYSDPDTLLTMIRTDDVYERVPGKTEPLKGWLCKTQWKMRHGQEPDGMMIKIMPEGEKIVTVIKRGIIPV